METYLPEKIEYAAYWSQNAQHFDQQSCYDWMAGLLAPLEPRKVLDIGCGVGNGLLALKSRFDPQIIALDENPACLSEAHRRLEEMGHAAEVLLRLGYQKRQDGKHTILTEQSPISVSRRISLVQADLLLGDTELTRFLANESPFDAVTVWLIGSDPTRSKNCLNLSSLGIASPEQYRLHVQNRIYGLASNVLRPGGWLQVVDRGEPPDTALLREDSLNSHRDQATLGTLQVFDLPYREYTEPKASGVGMVPSPGTSGRMPELKALAMVSVLSRKPNGEV
jgi:SAM-dependent methyltransferase